jgi:exonuclease SbcC
MIESITKEGYTNEKIVLAENYKSSNIRLIKYINEGKDVTFYLEHMLVNKNKLIGDIAVIKDLIVELEAKKIGLQSKADQYDAIANEKIIEIGLRQKAIQGLSDVKNYFMVLKRHFDFNDSYDIFLWTENFNMLKTRCSSEISHLQDALSIKESKEKQKGLEEKKKLLAEQIKRCHTANMTFELMPKLDDAVYDFLEKNKEKIIYFFQMLHMPKEFESKLEYDEKGYFKLIRKGSNDEVRCPQMSTGQRVSFTLSVFFSLHLSAINAPSFIMLDEPVTNLDDVHLLNLLDILRDFSLNGTQIFFTTANQEVAGLFRRKFSFFEEEFIHLKFERTNNLPVIIKKITYNPMEDAGNEILLEASTR